MPKSKIRKKKSKAKTPVSKKPDQLFDGGWYEVVRKGRNVFTRLKMTKNEHADWIAQIKENLPKFYEEIKQLITEVVTLINAYDKIFVVAGIASLAGEEMNKALEEDTADPEVAVEYCQSIAMATENTNQGKTPDMESLKKIYGLLKLIRSHFNFYYGFEHLKNDDRDIKSEIRSDMIRETLLVRGEGYLRHIKELFIEMFSPHDDFFVRHYGFKSSDIIETFEQLEYSFCMRVTSPEGNPHPTFMYELSRWELSRRGASQDEFVKKNPGLAVENGIPALYSITETTSLEKLYWIRHFNEIQEKVVKAVALEFGENKIFIDHSGYEILNESKIFTNPLVKGENDLYYMFSMNLAARNYFGIATNLIRKADSEYFNRSFMNNRVLISKDNFIEEKVLRLFKSMLPDVQFFKGVKYNFTSTDLDIKCAQAKDGNYELDILGISESATYVIEVKAGLLTDKAKRGAVLSLHSDLTKLIGDAICQSYRAYRFVVDNQDCTFKTKDGKTVEPINRENVIRISVSFSYVGGLISSLSKLQEFGVIEKNTEFAWTINIHDLIAFSEIIASEKELIDYLDKRIPLYQDKRLVNTDETALLGLYYAEDLKIHKDFKNSPHVQLNTRSYTKDFDIYFDHGGPKPRKKR